MECATTGSRSTRRRELAKAESNGVVARLFGFENEYMLATPLAVEEQCIRYNGPAKQAVYIFNKFLSLTLYVLKIRYTDKY
jgi:hypothetical protein